MMKLHWIIWSVIVMNLNTSSGFPHGRRKSFKLLVIMANGLRYDYPDEDMDYIGFPKMARQGVRAPYLVPVFPSKNYPNWLSLVTGLYPENHGFINNEMYDPEYEDMFLGPSVPTSYVPHWWNHAEPLWITAEKQGLRSALFWWDGCSVQIKGQKPSYCKPYKYVYLNQTKDALKTIISLFKNDEMELVLLYYEAIGINGEVFGPESVERKLAMRDFDSLLSWLQIEILKSKLSKEVNTIVLSDHGMISADTTMDTEIIALSKHIDENDIKIASTPGPYMNILPKEGKLDELYNDLKKVKGLRVYRKTDIPQRYHIANSRMVQPLVLIAKKGYIIQAHGDRRYLEDIFLFDLGQNGYDPLEVFEMSAIFYARGPCFKRDFETSPLSIVDIYNVMCDVMGIKALPNNGTRGRTSPMINPKCFSH